MIEDEDIMDIGEAIAKQLWNEEGGGKDFHEAKYNHAIAEGFEVGKLWQPYFPQRLFGKVIIEIPER